jgi:hypothetical protein
MIRPRRRISIGLETARQEADEEEMQRKQDIVGLVVEHVWGGGLPDGVEHAWPVQ